MYKESKVAFLVERKNIAGSLLASQIIITVREERKKALLLQHFLL